jgi:hypothetical protein
MFPEMEQVKAEVAEFLDCEWWIGDLHLFPAL